jgi:WD40 repeat protein/DNA-binding SARP family transcriptional activator
VDFRLLGRLEVWDGSRPVALGGPKQKAVLAALLLRHGEVVSTDLLIDDVWGERASGGAAKTLQVYVWQLRRALEPGRLPGSPPRLLVTQTPGYTLRIEDDQLDAARFEHLARSGRVALDGGDTDRALGLLDDALGLWRGAALAEFTYQAFAEPEIARLEELRLAAIEDRIDAELALGGHRHAVAELEALVARQPLRERLRRQLILAMYRSDRQADALAACREARSMLVDELGIDPSPTLQELERAILNQDPSLALSPSRATQRSNELALGGTVRLPAGMTGHESGVLSFLIADIRGYTAFTQAHGDEAAAELAVRFARIACEGVEAHGGKVAELRGDEALAVFPSPRQALRAAVELQLTFADECRLRPNLPLRVGIGLDAGEAVPVHGGYRGGPLNLAARLCGRAGVGEIILSQSVFLLARPLPGFTFDELGELELKGLAQPVPVFRARPEGADPAERETESDTHAPHVDVEPAELPAAFSARVPSIGRDREVRRLGWAWRRTRRGRTAVVLVTGIAGMGKTRLLAEGAVLAAEDGARVDYVDLGVAATSLSSSITRSTDGAAWWYLAVDGLEQASIADVDAVERLLRGDWGPSTLVAAAIDTDRAAADVVRAVHRLVDEDAVIRLAPLALDDMRHIGELYVGGQAERIPADLLEATGGVPQRAHEAVADWAHTETAQRFDGYSAVTASGRGDLREAEAGLAGSIVDLQVVRERASVFGRRADAPTAPPYKGLARFDVGDGEWFFGRERLVADMVSRLVGARLLGIVGPSGSGKSSAVRAGLVATLTSGVLPGTEHRIVALMRPGEHPLRALDRAIWAAAPEPVREQLAREDGLLSSIPEALAGDQRLLLVVDQFEEVFTLCSDENERVAFIDGLVDALADTQSRVVTVIAIRADFYGHCAGYPALASHLAANHVLVGAMSTEEYRQVIEQPAIRAGTRIEPALVDTLASQVLGEAGALPLLSTALLELWEHRTGSRITSHALAKTGGVQGAVARLAEGVYSELDGKRRLLARGMFLRLAGPGEGTSVVKRRVPLTEFDTEHDKDVAELLDLLARERLLTLDESSVEIVHEALLREWPRYQGWLEEDQQGRLLHAHLAVAAREWAERGRDPAELYRGARLSAADEWATRHDADLNPGELEFLTASRVLHQRQVRRLRGFLAGALALLLVAAIAAGIALVQRSSAQRAATTADAQRLGAQALVDNQLDRSLLLAREGINLDDSAATRSDLFADMLRFPAAIGVLRTPHGAGLEGIAVSPDGKLLAVGTDRGTVLFFDTRSRKEVGAFSVPPDPKAAALAFNDDAAVAFQPHGSLLAVAAGGHAQVWLVDQATRRPVGSVSVPTPTQGVSRLAFSPDGRILVAGFATEANAFRAQRFDVATRAPIGAPGRLDSAWNGVDGLRYSPDGRRVIASSYVEQRIVVLDAASWHIRRTYPTQGGAAAIAVSPDGATLAIGYDNGTLRFLDLTTGKLRVAKASNHTLGDWSVEFTPNGREVVTTAEDHSPLVTDVASGLPVEALTGHTDAVVHQAIAGQTLYTGGPDGKTIMWDLGGSRRLGRLLSYSLARGVYTSYGPQSEALAISPDGTQVALTPTPTPSDNGVEVSQAKLLPAAVQRWDLRSLRPVGPPLRGFVSVVCCGNSGGPEDIAYSHDGSLLAAGNGAGSKAVVWDLRTGRIVRRFTPPYASKAHGGGLAFNPSGGTLAYGDAKHAVVLWNLHTGGVTQLPLGRGIYASSLDYNNDGTRLATADYAGRVILWDTRTNRQLKVIDGVPVGDDNNPEPQVQAFSPNGAVLATAHGDGVAFWSSRTGRPVGSPIHLASGGAGSIAFSPNGRVLAVAANDGVELWDVSSHQLIDAPLAGPNHRIAFASDGQILVGTQYNGTGQAVIWNLAPAVWEARACQIAGRNLTQAEWERYLPDRPYAPVCS